MTYNHRSVLLEEVIQGLTIKPEGIYVDGTLGGGGHSYEICQRLTSGKLIGIDRDQSAIEAATERLSIFGDKVTILYGNYSDIKKILWNLKLSHVDGIILDLGVSSHQLDTKKRGFSYRMDAPLDMRMDRRQDVTAKDIVNQYSELDLYRIIRDYGEDKFAKNIAKHIVLEREKQEIATTFQLNEVIARGIPMKIQKNMGHPSKKTFQAIRIELNQELEVLKQSLNEMIDTLKPTGRICIITFHSLEDRIVKTNFRGNENPCICPPSFPVCNCGKEPRGKIITRKPILPSERECRINPRAKSAKLRIFEKF
jgi:16S rRNA (cytosine1402-N4)-methyltransferase